MLNHHFNLDLWIAHLCFVGSSEKTFISSYGNVFTIAISSFSTTIKYKIHKTIEYLDETVVRKFRVESTKIECGNWLCFVSFIKSFKTFKDWFRILHDPKAVVVFVKRAFIVIRLNLFEDFFKNDRDGIAKWFGRTWCRCYNETSFRRWIMHFWSPVDEREGFHFIRHIKIVRFAKF